MKTAQLIDQARARSSILSDYRLAKNLGASSQMVSSWRAGLKYPSTWHIFELAKLAGRNPAEVIAELETERAERAGSVDQAQNWRGVLQRLAGASAAAGVVLMTGAPVPASAAGQTAGASAAPLYIMSTRRRRSAWLAAMFCGPSVQHT
jgi:hypothetical protein